MLIIDANNIGYINLHKLSDLSYEEKPTGVIFGFLRSVLMFAEKFETRDIVFCWDSMTSLRKLFYPNYKSSRNGKNLTEEQQYLRQIGYYQFELLRTEILPKLGFKNIFVQEGIEADDLIAKVVQDYPNKENIIISSDRDLFQLLNKIKGIYIPTSKKFYTKETFTKEWGIDPDVWVKAKAIAGDKSDNIEGILGIGLLTACRYLNGKIGENTRKKIELFDEKIKRNIKLVNIPHYRTKPVIVQEDFLFDLEYFNYICQKYYLLSFQKKENFLRWRKIFYDPS